MNNRPHRPGSSTTSPRVGLFGLLGSGNTGNDVSMESILGYLRASHPEATIDAMCGGPETLKARYGVDAIPVLWYLQRERSGGRATTAFLKTVGKALDVFRTAAWVRGHDVVIVPGAGALEATLPVRAFGFPYSMFLLCASGKLFGTKVALVSVGANMIQKRSTRSLLNAAARLAYYRSYRDTLSLEAMRERGIDTAADRVYPDLAFAAPVPPTVVSDARTVGVGVMDYYGGNDDRGHSQDIHLSYLENMKAFSRWLLDSGHNVRLFGGDSKFDDDVALEILADLRAYRPDLDPARAQVVSAGSFGELMQQISTVSSVVATRYHNVVCALKLSKPTIALGYSEKFTSIMSDMGLAEFCQSARDMDVDQLIAQFQRLEQRSADLQQEMADRNAVISRLIDEQFTRLSAFVIPANSPARSSSSALRA
jgi:polysaccharide pyruvyl transferase WcaK-like protein